ncbi:MAG: transposase [Chloroflexi bacterium]|nr:transposase [Chloroflexota bacterium]
MEGYRQAAWNWIRTRTPKTDDKVVLNGIVCVLVNGCRWRDLPPEYGKPTTCYQRLREWESDGA